MQFPSNCQNWRATAPVGTTGHQLFSLCFGRINKTMELFGTQFEWQLSSSQDNADLCAAFFSGGGGCNVFCTRFGVNVGFTTKTKNWTTAPTTTQRKGGGAYSIIHTHTHTHMCTRHTYTHTHCLWHKTYTHTDLLIGLSTRDTAYSFTLWVLAGMGVHPAKVVLGTRWAPSRGVHRHKAWRKLKTPLLSPV